MPLEFVEFLDFHRYDIVFLLQHLALKFFHNGDQLLLQQKPYAFSLLEVSLSNLSFILLLVSVSLLGSCNERTNEAPLSKSRLLR